jgi:toxin ParE1/3/4
VQIKFSTRAQRDLKAIWLFIHAENPSAADRLLKSIDHRIQQLRDHLFSGQTRYDLGPGIRHLVAGQYLVLYRAAQDHILIVRVFHGNRRLPTRL